ncbi:rho GTPase-activating protein 44-like [Clupea harengus]|uniref:Rho GTPase-activating protein 44-like n=1 Tax=Clupea harengus TaxID=7950 RepID=A0A8M1KBJ2_CLUHA|nr:rho GTPase-activating protein 44-like [Clupea harengus]
MCSAQDKRYLIKFLAKLDEYEDANKMTPGNIAIVLGPNLLWDNNEGNITEMMTTVSLQIVSILEPIIQHADWIFPGEIEFNVTGNYGSPVHTNHNANYSSMPSPDMDHSERKQSDQSRRPLSVATDNMMLEFYKKDGIRKIQSMGVRVMDTSWVSRRGSSSARKTSSTPPSLQGPCLPGDEFGDLYASPSPTPPGGSSDRVSTLKNKELSPVIGQKAMQSAPSSGHSLCTDQSPHTLRKVSKKLAPIPPKGSYPPSDQSTGQPSPISLSPTPPSTPSPYSFSYPQGYATIASPSQCQSQATTPPSFSASSTGTLPKARPAPKPRQRPSLPPPQPPSTPGSSPLPLEHGGLLEGLSPGESMSTESFCNLDIPAINVELDGILEVAYGALHRHSVVMAAVALEASGRAEPEEDSESTAL